MSIFRRPDYHSDASLFIDQLKASKPTLEAEQRAGRALLWDKSLNRADQAGYRQARVAQQPYVYGTSSATTEK
jgi:hypothetical protein